MVVDQYIISVRTKGDKEAAKGLKGVGKAGKDMSSRLDSALKSVTNLAAGFFAAQGLLRGMQRSIELAGRFQDVSNAFENLTTQTGFSSETFNKLNEALDGTVNSMDIMTQANKSLLLGIFETEDQMAEMFDVAQQLGKAMGLDVLESIDRLTTGLGRQSQLRLDDLGIMIDVTKANKEFAESIGITSKELTAHQRKQVFLNTAIAEARDLTKDLGGETTTLNTEMAKLNTILDELAIGVGTALTPNLEESTVLLDNLQSILTAENVSSYLETILDLGSAYFTNVSATGQVVQWAVKLHETFGLLKDRTGEVADGMDKMKSPFDLEDLETAQAISEIFTQIESPLTEAGAEAQRIKDEGVFDVFPPPEHPNYMAYLDSLKIAKEETKSLNTEMLRSTASLARAMGAGLAEFAGGAKAAGRLQQISAVINAYATINKIMADPKLAFPTNVISATAVGAQAFANVMQISKSMGEFKAAATGMNEIVTQPTMILAGEAGAESVNITPLSGGGSTSGMTVNINGGMISQEFVENELAEAISTAVRRGSSFA